MQPEEEKRKKELFALRGGVRGKFLRTLSVLQNEMETIKAAEENAKNPGQYMMVKPLFENMPEQFQEVQTFGMQAAEIALGSLLRRSLNPRTMDLREYLERFEKYYLEELSLYALRGQFNDKDKSDSLIIKVDLACLCSMQVHLLCGIMQINPAADTSFYCTKDGHLIYHDSSSHLSEDDCALLQEGKVHKETLSRSDLDFLLVHAYAKEIGWKITVKQESGLTVDFLIPQTPMDFGTWELRSEREENPDRYEECRTVIREELASIDGEQE